jgi:hypothetical protein
MMCSPYRLESCWFLSHRRLIRVAVGNGRHYEQLRGWNCAKANTCEIATKCSELTDPHSPLWRKVGRLEGRGNAHGPKFDVMSSLCRAINSNGAAAARRHEWANANCVDLWSALDWVFSGFWRWIVAILNGYGAFNMPSCIRFLLLRHCETPKSKLTRYPHCIGAVLTDASANGPWQFLQRLSSRRQSYPCSTVESE